MSSSGGAVCPFTLANPGALRFPRPGNAGPAAWRGDALPPPSLSSPSSGFAKTLAASPCRPGTCDPVPGPGVRGRIHPVRSSTFSRRGDKARAISYEDTFLPLKKRPESRWMGREARPPLGGLLGAPAADAPRERDLPGHSETPVGRRGWPKNLLSDDGVASEPSRERTLLVVTDRAGSALVHLRAF